ncbi:hypothetical protein BH23PAT2_BH23PAT2_08780 [soil metagenome]
MSAIDTLLNPRHRRACTYKAVKPFLYKPMPAIQLKYFKAPSAEEREAHTQETDLICSQCGKKVAVLGWTNTITGEAGCDLCAIEDYKYFEGFKTLKAAEAHRRRMFDTGYLLTEVLIDDYLAYYKLLDHENISVGEQQILTEISTALQNMIPKPKKIELQNTLDQTKIERHYKRLIGQYIEWPKNRQSA